MTLYKPLLDILKNAKAGTVADILSKLNVISTGTQEIPFTEQTLKIIEEIAYAIDFLEKGNLVSVRVEAMPIPRVLADPAIHATSQAEYLQSLLTAHYPKHLITTPAFAAFADHGYRSSTTREREYRTLLLFIKTILFATITAALNRLLN